MWAVRAAAAKLVMVMLLQRAGTDRQHSSGAHVGTVGSQGGDDDDDVMAASDVDAGLSEVSGMEDVDVGSDSEDEVGSNSEDEVGSVDVMVSSADVEFSSMHDAEVVSSAVETLSDGAAEVFDSGTESDAEVKVGMMIVSNVESEIGVGRTEVTDSEDDETVGNGLQRPRLRCFFWAAPLGL